MIQTIYQLMLDSSRLVMCYMSYGVCVCVSVFTHVVYFICSVVNHVNMVNVVNVLLPVVIIVIAHYYDCFYTIFKYHSIDLIMKVPVTIVTGS